MLEIHELLGRELDPIDDVRRQFECYYTGGSYFEPLNGDWISDDYYRIIDLTTQPQELSKKEAGQLEGSITRLNEKHPYIQSMLGGSSLLGAYNEVAEQVSAINAGDPDRGNIPQMQASSIEVSDSV